MLSEENLLSIYQEYSLTYNLSVNLIESIVRLSLSQVYNGIGPATVEPTGHIIITQIIKGSYEVKRIILSSKKRKEFKKVLTENLDRELKKMFKQSFTSLAKKANNIFYAQPMYNEDGRVTFKIFNRKKEVINNLYGNIKIENLLKINYNQADIFFFVSVPDSPNVIHKDGKFYVEVKNKSANIIKLYLNVILKKLNSFIENSFTYSSVKIDYNNYTVFVVLKNKYINKSSSEYINNKMNEYCGLKCVVTTSRN
ncbi:hypothetical protein KKG82_06085 [Patescibacteria group bacterium]|nr:hypothetical protein [Patescibacteria group bacterium]